MNGASSTQYPDPVPEGSRMDSVRLHVARMVRSVSSGAGRLRAPRTTLALIVANLCMALAQAAAGGFHSRGGEIAQAPADWALGAKVPSLIAHGEYWRLVTASFL